MLQPCWVFMLMWLVYGLYKRNSPPGLKWMRLELNLAWSWDNFAFHARHDVSLSEGGEPLIIYDSRRSSRRSCAPVSPWHLICLKISECAVWSWRVDVRGFSSSSLSSFTPTPQHPWTARNSIQISVKNIHIVYTYLWVYRGKGLG